MGEMVSLTLWLGFSFLAGWYWSSKGRTLWGGFTLSIFLSPLAGFIVGLFLRPDHRVLEGRRLMRGDTRRCPYCAEILQRAAVRCRYCGMNLVETPTVGPEKFDA